MKTTLSLLLMLLTTSLVKVYCQKDCKLEINKDQFTGQNKIYTKDITLKSVFPLMGSKDPWNLDISFGSINDTAMLILTHASQGSTSAVRTFYVKFKNGTVFTKEYPDNSGGEYDNGHGYRYENTQLPLSKEELEKFANNTIEQVRVVFVYFPDEPSFDKVIEEKKAKKIQAYAKCLLSEIKK